mmetsp:Transcript_12127/g.30081  ORF Transcript_12127/g.30081 Transcript_12127/m.30081 type:complete len:124 (+) Transcript_12127:226-597(+)
MLARGNHHVKKERQVRRKLHLSSHIITRPFLAPILWMDDGFTVLEFTVVARHTRPAVTRVKSALIAVEPVSLLPRLDLEIREKKTLNTIDLPFPAFSLCGAVCGLSLCLAGGRFICVGRGSSS